MESLFLSIIVAKHLNIFPHANNGRSREKKISGKAICSRHQRESAPSRFGARVSYWIWLRGSASYVIKAIVFQVSCNYRMLIYVNALVQVSGCVPDIICDHSEIYRPRTDREAHEV